MEKKKSRKSNSIIETKRRQRGETIFCRERKTEPKKIHPDNEKKTPPQIEVATNNKKQQKNELKIFFIAHQSTAHCRDALIFSGIEKEREREKLSFLFA